MNGDTIISLSGERERRGRPIRSYTVTVEQFAPDEPPAFTLRGLGNEVRDIDVRQLNRDMLECALVFSTEARDAGGQSTAVAFASIWTDGSVSTLADVEIFRPAARRAWLGRAVQLVGQSFDDLLGPMPVSNPQEIG